MASLNIQKYQDEFDELAQKTMDPSQTDSRELGKLFSRQSELQEIISTYQELETLKKKLSDAQEMSRLESDAELREMAELEVSELEPKIETVQKKLDVLIVPPDPNDGRNAIIELRAGTGGEEASLFASELFRMYSRYSTLKKWNVQVMNITESDSGGAKEVVFKVSGSMVYKHLKNESGVHRVQRVPATESAGRIHTSAASVVVMPEIDDIDIKVNPNDLVIDVYRSSGHGGQSVNTTDSAVRITHIPSGLVVTCQDTKDQQKNKQSALSVLRARLYQIELEKQQSEISDIRKTSIKTGDRSDKIKTYNFPQDRLTDHRIHKSWFGLDPIMAGEIDDILQETIVELQKVESPA